MILKHKLLKMLFTLNQRITMYEKISAFLEGGIDLDASLRKIRNRYALRKDFRAIIMSDWINEIDNGAKFSDSIAPWIPPSELMLIESGEHSGDLPVGLKMAGVLSSAAAQNKTAIVSSLAFPLMLVGMLAFMLMLFQLKMVPVFLTFSDVSRWPASAQLLNSISSFIHDYWLTMVVTTIILGIIIGKTMGTWIKPPRYIFDKLPPWSIYRSYQASSFLIALSSLLKANVPLYDAFQKIYKNSSPWMQDHLDKMMGYMNLGAENLGRALDTGLLDQETAGDVQDYSETGTFFKAIHIMGERTLAKGVEKIKSRMAVVKNILLVLVTACIIWIYYTTFDLQSTIADNQSYMSNSALQ